MIAAIKPSLMNLNIVDVSHRVKATSSAVGKSIYSSIKNATAEDVKNFTAKAATNIAAGALTKAFVGAALAGSAPAVVTVGATAIAVGAVSTKIAHWRDCKKAIENNEEPPKFNWKNYGLKGMFNTAMVGLGAFFSESILGIFSADSAAAQTAPLPTDAYVEDLPQIAEEPPMDILSEPLVPEMNQDLDVMQPIADLANAAPEIFVDAPIVATPDAAIIDDLDTINIHEIKPFEPVPVVSSLETLNAPDNVEIETNAFISPPVIEEVQLIAPETLENDAVIKPVEAPEIEVQAVTPEIALSIEEPTLLEPVTLPETLIQAVPLNDVPPQLEINMPEISPPPEFDAVSPDSFDLETTMPIAANDVSLTVEAVDVDTTPAETITATELSAIEELQAIDIGPRAEYALDAHINGNAQGTADLGYFYFHGEQGVPQDYERAVEFYREAAEQNNVFAVRDLSYVEGEAEKVLGYAVPETIESPAQNAITDVVINEPEINEPEIVELDIEPDTLSPVEQLQALDLGLKAETALEAHINGNAQGTADLGYFYFHGEQGLPQDYEKAVHFYREAAAEGNRFAIRDLAYIENQAEKALGHAVPHILDEATANVADQVAIVTENAISELQTMDLGGKAEIALEAHINGNAQGTADLGYFYFHGQQGIPQDLEKAVDFYREAALEGNGYAIRDLAFVESEALKAGIAITEFELPEHLSGKSAPAISTNSGSAGNTVRSGLRASCVGNLQGFSGSEPELRFDCDVRGNHKYIYPGEHVSIKLPNGVSQTFNLDATAGRQPVNDFLGNSVLPVATNAYTPN